MKTALPLALAALPAFADDAALIQSRVEATAAAMRAGDLETLLSGYAPGALVVFGPGAEARGETQLAAAYTEFIALKPEITFGPHNVLTAGDLALHLGGWEMTGTGPDGTTVTDGGFSVVLMRRDPDGEWRMVIDAPYATAVE